MSNEEDTDLPSSFQCPNCELQFKCLTSLDNHLKYHTKENLYECKTCHWSFYTKRDHTRHLNKLDGGCGANYKSTEDGKKLVQLRNKKSVYSEYVCELCDKAFVSSYGLIRHKRLHSGERPYSCHDCGQSFIDTGDLSKHMKIHDGETSLQCKICDKICISKQRLESHMFKHNDKDRYKCQVCNKVCKCKSHLDEHLRTHSGERPFKCSLCDSSYRYKSQLKDHAISKHSGAGVQLSSNKVFGEGMSSQVECDICGALLSRQSLRHHKLLHKEKGFKCDQCDKAFISNYRLDVHKRSHTGERPFLCQVPECGKAMTTKDGLMRHMVIHEGKKNHECPHCGRKFYYTSNLNQHLQTHGGQESKRYTCLQCNKSFSRKSILRKHQSNPCHGVITANTKPFQVELGSEGIYTFPKTGLSLKPIQGDIKIIKEEVGADPSQETTYIQLIIDESNKQLLNTGYILTGDASGINPTQVKPAESTVEQYQQVKIESSSWDGLKQISENFDEFECVKISEADISANNSASDQQQLQEENLHTPQLEWPSEEKDSQPNAETIEPKAKLNEEFSNDVSTVNAEVQTDHDFGNEDSSEAMEEDEDFYRAMAEVPATSEAVEENQVTVKEENTASSLQVPADEAWVEDSSPPQNGDSQSSETWAEESTHQDNEIPQSSEEYASVVTAIEDQQAQEIILSEGDLSNLMTLAGVSSDSEAHLNQVENVVIVTFGQESVKIHTDKSFSEHNKEVNEAVNAQAQYSPSSDTGTASLLTFAEEDSRFPVVTFECLHCPELFKYQYAIEEHCASVHPGQDIYKCYDCEETFDSIKSLTRHSTIHDGNSKVQCSYCHKIFTHPTKLSNHMVRHTGVKPKRFKCDFCDRRFYDSTHLRDHMMVHSGEKPYGCEQCGLKFVRKRDLEVHLRIHTGELPFKCLKCSKSFRAEIYLKNHLLVHNASKPFQCSQCDKGYITRAKLTLHMMNHSGNKPWKCDVPNCGKSYSDKRDFKHHQMRHRGEKPLKCPICSKGFILRGNLIQHQKVHSKVKE